MPRSTPSVEADMVPVSAGRHLRGDAGEEDVASRAGWAIGGLEGENNEPPLPKKGRCVSSDMGCVGTCGGVLSCEEGLDLERETLQLSRSLRVDKIGANAEDEVGWHSEEVDSCVSVEDPEGAERTWGCDGGFVGVNRVNGLAPRSGDGSAGDAAGGKSSSFGCGSLGEGFSREGGEM
jgi:hypothetical protein